MKGRRVVVVGVPGVGKSTVITKTLESLKERGVDAEAVIFGTVMFEQARKFGVKHRDEMRKLPVAKQRLLQVRAAKILSKMRRDVLIVDTHLFIDTGEGYWPGLPMNVLEALSPTNFVLVEAKPTEIISRREADETRVRDKADSKAVERELEYARQMISATSVLTGAPALVVQNSEGRAYEAASKVTEALVTA